MVGVQSVVRGLVETFGPFLIPVTVFAIGIVGYTVLFLVSRQFRPDEDEGVVNLSAGTPERSATGKDHGASTRGVRPSDGDGVGEESDGREAEDPESSGTEGGDDAHDRTGDTLRHND